MKNAENASSSAALQELTAQQLADARKAAQAAVDALMLTDAPLLFPPGQLALAAMRSGFNKVCRAPHMRSLAIVGLTRLRVMALGILKLHGATACNSLRRFHNSMYQDKCAYQQVRCQAVLHAASERMYSMYNHAQPHRTLACMV